MPPIPVYANVPLKPDGVTPQTAALEDGAASNQQTPTPTTNPTAIEKVLHDPSAPLPPQPGARPIPSTATSGASSSNPPRAQPGAFPNPHGGQTITAHHTTTQTSYLPPPSQLSIPSPVQNQAPRRSTLTTNTPSIPHPAPIAQFSPAETGSGERRHSLEHPPGYQQNPYAQDGSAQDRARFENAALEAKQEEGVLGSVKAWAGYAGESLKKGEEAAWKFIQEKGGK